MSKKKIKEVESKPDWTTPCEVCGAVPTVPETGMCGPLHLWRGWIPLAVIGTVSISLLIPFTL